MRRLESGLAIRLASDDVTAGVVNEEHAVVSGGDLAGLGRCILERCVARVELRPKSGDDPGLLSNKNMDGVLVHGCT